ncbi:hypothetical protein CRG98_032563 [Punica granatum]|uniref:EF-hand domain-containing protein n=1 Tax=Punica granatum TaxID=22663 RepID=A0A2I0ISQ5_PUNGR|nr:hypothetical protein CRG98_032563 [Punica granatum]
MGNAQSPPADPRFTSASRSLSPPSLSLAFSSTHALSIEADRNCCRAFTRKELEDLRSLFVSLALQSQSGGECISLPVFQTYFQLHGPLSERLFDLIKQKREDQKLTFEDLVIAKATYEKGTAEEIEEFVYQFLDVNGDGVLGRSDLSSVLITIFKNIFDNDLSEDHAASEQNTVRIFLDSANFSINIEGHDEKSMSLADLRSWFAVLPSVRKFLGSLLMPPDPDLAA